ncbi:unnamed protein product [marine sediment metagenome]|uniref:Uncharacterized protein n=1 Tax=marine sediment metagenome TaxID=412755 RepID=X1H7F1_9ZZZZ
MEVTKGLGVILKLGSGVAVKEGSSIPVTGLRLITVKSAEVPLPVLLPAA